MGFTDLDPLEKYLNKTVESMTASDLVTYVKTYQKVVHKVDLVIDPQVPRERSIFQALQRVYGDEAGLIVKWVFWKYQGKYNGKLVNFFDFQKSHKWWTDLMHQEAQLQVAKEVQQPKCTTTDWSQAGFATSL